MIFATGSAYVIINPNAKKTRLLGYDSIKNAFKLDVAAPPDNNKANIEIIKFLYKLTGKRVKILSGKTSKLKLIKFE